MLFQSGCLIPLEERKWMFKVPRLWEEEIIRFSKEIMAGNKKRVKKILSANIEGKDPKKGTTLSTGIWENWKLE